MKTFANRREGIDSIAKPIRKFPSAGHKFPAHQRFVCAILIKNAGKFTSFEEQSDDGDGHFSLAMIKFNCTSCVHCKPANYFPRPENGWQHNGSAENDFSHTKVAGKKRKTLFRVIKLTDEYICHVSPKWFYESPSRCEINCVKHNDGPTNPSLDLNSNSFSWISLESAQTKV